LGGLGHALCAALLVEMTMKLNINQLIENILRAFPGTFDQQEIVLDVSARLAET